MEKFRFWIIYFYPALYLRILCCTFPVKFQYPNLFIVCQFIFISYAYCLSAAEQIWYYQKQIRKRGSRRNNDYRRVGIIGLSRSCGNVARRSRAGRSEEHTSELQSR